MQQQKTAFWISYDTFYRILSLTGFDNEYTLYYTVFHTDK
jgi:hypothetical protein